jgi:hypothetical protein
MITLYLNSGSIYPQEKQISAFNVSNAIYKAKARYLCNVSEKADKHNLNTIEKAIKNNKQIYGVVTKSHDLYLTCSRDFAMTMYLFELEA